MLDIVFSLLLIGFFAATVGCVAACEQLRPKTP